METHASEDLHGNVPNSSAAALLLVDVINDLDFPKNENLLKASRRLADAIGSLKERCTRTGIPTIYVNDNHDKWRSDMQHVVQWATRENSPGRDFAQRLLPSVQDYVVLKPKHSAFFATPLHAILEHLGAKTLIFAGVTANACVLISVGDAYVHGYKCFVPCDCVEALTTQGRNEALRLMKESFGADTRTANELNLQNLTSRRAWS